jgi:hypothetical protein
MKKTLAALALGLAALPLLAGSAFAHGCHRDVEEGRAGWHRHGHECRRISVEREHRRHREPVCEKKCHYVGPFKECKTVCN